MKRKVIVKKGMGNPLAILAADQVAKEYKQPITNGLKWLGIGALGFGTFWIGSKAIKVARQKSLYKKALSDPEISSAIKIYDAIPAGLKKSEGGLFNPMGFVKDIGNTISTIWQKTDTKNILAIAKTIQAEKLNKENISKHFQTLYGEPLYPLMQKALGTEDMALFENYTESESGSKTKPPTKFQYALSAVNKLNVRSAAKDIKDIDVFTKTNKIGIAVMNQVVGYTTGKEYRDADANVVFVEIQSWVKKGDKRTRTTYVWKGGLQFVDKDTAQKLSHGNTLYVPVK